VHLLEAVVRVAVGAGEEPGRELDARRAHVDDALHVRGVENGLDVRRIGPDDAALIEPNVRCVGAIEVASTGVVDFKAVCAKIVDILRARGCSLHTGAPVEAVSGGRVRTSNAILEAGVIIACAGLQSDRVATLAGVRPPARIIPFRGEYFTLREERRHLVRNLIYPVPDPKFPFLGVHFTRLIHGGVEAGPNAVLATAREGYRWSAFNLRDFGESVLFPGLWKFLAAYPAMSWYEVRRSLSKRMFCRSLQRLVPEIRAEDLEAGGAGVRAQAMTADGRLVEDFRFDEAKGILHVVNAPSPAATASLAIGETIARRVLAQRD
jgi:L-2-hydroxyglutarate oxidase